MKNLFNTLFQSVKMAIKSISGNKMRAFLTMLGIIIGVFSLVVLVSLVNGATDTVTGTISDLGNDMLSVTVTDDKGVSLTLEELSQWSDQPGIGHIATSAESVMTAKCAAEATTATVTGTVPSYAQIQGLNLLLGRFLKTPDVTSHTHVCVVNETAAQELVGYTDCLGAELALNGTKFTVVGVLEDDTNSLTSLFGGNLAIYIPYTTLLRLSATTSPDISSFYVSAETTVEEAETAITAILTERLGDEDAFHVLSTAILEDAMSDVTSILSILLGGIAAVSLIVGGIGIMNIMLVTVTERTREIGIRKAIGATRGTILTQFLIEAIILCMMGCAIGIFLSWATLRAVSNVVSSLSMTFRLDPNVVLLSVVFCFFIGLIFGLYPANKAAKMQPIDALHYGG